ncbi:hypothetical protein B0J11DRAFT_616525 [Dendryphion nanum]|uniref:Carrier domain-containing protein n=1 Tax=Dendryphion nanum TaxID=256645 RepID=A0A9P9DL08_9PLEO|nr:hypothetical protein B0J11DRAFT_616525 [Dendryphion nanum]
MPAKLLGLNVFEGFVLPQFDASLPPPSDATIKTVVELIDFNTAENPNYLFCLQAEKSLDGPDSPQFLRVTYKLFRDMILSCQSWLEKNLANVKRPIQDKAGNISKGPPVALFLDSDVGLLAYVFALMGLGIPVVLLSTRLSPHAIKSLMAETSTVTVIASPRQEGVVREALELFPHNERPSVHISLPYRRFTKSLFELPETKIASVNHYISESDRDVLILHSSGTTGLPKAISHSHRFLLSLSPHSSFEFDDTWTIDDERVMTFSTLPMYHCFGLVAPMASLSIGKPFALPPSGFIPSATSAVEFIKMIDAGTLHIVPSILQDIVEIKNGAGIDALRPLKYVVTGGGPLSESAGSKLVKSGVKLINGFGATEMGSLSIYRPPSIDNDWRYFRVREDIGCRIQEVISSETSRQSIPRYKITMRPPGWIEDFTISDQFVTSNKKPGRDFKPIERTDDVIVLKTGEKVMPHILETMLSDRSEIRAVVAFGHGQFEIGVLIEPACPISVHEVDSFKDLIWPTILEAGKKMDSQARITSPHAVVILKLDQSFPRSGKNSVLRKATYAEFSDEIAQAYALLEGFSTPSLLPKLVNGTSSTKNSLSMAKDVNGARSNTGVQTAAASKEEIDRMLNGVIDLVGGPLERPWDHRPCADAAPEDDFGDEILEYIQKSIWKPHAAPLNKNDDLFELGMDSLQANQLRRFLISEAARLSAKVDIPKDFLYEFPSISKITAYLRGGTSMTTKADTVTIEQLMQQFVPAHASPKFLMPEVSATILMTGGTGGLGSHVLSHLASNTTITRIICLNRPSSQPNLNAYVRQFNSNETKGAHILLSVIDKIEILETNTTLPLLGLSQPAYWSIASSITHIIHNAFPVDFKRNVSSFESQFATMTNLLQLAHDSTSSARFIFISSIAVVAQCQSTPAVSIPELPFQPDWAPPTMGYGQAKLICEKMLEQATKDKGLDGIIARCAQISGAKSNGYWNPSEYFPTLLRISRRVGALPLIEGTLSWLPLEDAASTITDLLLAPKSTSSQLVYHVENPARQTWSSVLQILSNSLALPLITYEQWLKRVNNLNGDDTSLNEFYSHGFLHIGSGALGLATEQTKKVSYTLSRMGTVGNEVVGRYAARFVG